MYIIVHTVYCITVHTSLHILYIQCIQYILHILYIQTYYTYGTYYTYCAYRHTTHTAHTTHTVHTDILHIRHILHILCIQHILHTLPIRTSNTHRRLILFPSLGPQSLQVKVVSLGTNMGDGSSQESSSDSDRISPQFEGPNLENERGLPSVVS